jgi:hypothetical protein
MCKNCTGDNNDFYKILGIEPVEGEQIFISASPEAIKADREQLRSAIKIARNYSMMKKLLAEKDNE